MRLDALLGSTLHPRIVRALSTNTTDFAQVNSVSVSSGIPYLQKLNYSYENRQL